MSRTPPGPDLRTTPIATTIADWGRGNKERNIGTDLGSKSGSFDSSRRSVDVDLSDPEDLHLLRGEEDGVLDRSVLSLNSGVRLDGVGSRDGRVLILISSDGCPGSGRLGVYRRLGVL
jgi:hypothetical protein